MTRPEGGWDYRTRVLLVAVIPMTLIAVALAWYFTQTRIGDLEDALRSRGQTVARQLAPASEFGVFSGNHELLAQLAQSAATEAGVSGVMIVDAAGVALASSGRLLRAAGLRPPFLPDAGMTDAGEVMIFYAPIGRMQTAAADPFTIEPALKPRMSRPLGAVLVEVSRAPLERRKMELIGSAMAITLGGLAIAVWLARRLGRGVTRPVMQLAETVSRIERGDLAARARIEAGGALRLLESGINDMAAALQAGRHDLEARVAEATVELQRQKDAAEQANRAKTQFLAAASHDLRQPLQALGLFVSTLQLRAKDAETLQLIGRIEGAMGALENVLETLLDISKLDAGVVAPEIQSFPLQPLLDSLRNTFSATAQQRGLRLEIRPTAMWCRSDPNMLERILANLVSNALRYTHQGGVVVGARRAGVSLRVEVWDTGIGIPADKREEIFREFVQLGAPARARDKGLGLGLAIVDRLCKLLGHRLALRSIPARGTCFAVTVPRTLAHDAAREPAPARAATLQDRLVVVIDDEVDVLQGMSEFLALQGAQVVQATNLGEALARLAEARAPPAAIVSDYRLGAGEDGIGAIAAIRSRYGADIPAVVVTGDPRPEVLRALSEAQLPCLHKPVASGVLLNIIGQRIAARESMSAGA